MKIITTPMCEDVLKIANINEYEVVNVNQITDGDVAITLSETEVPIEKISVKLNTYTQLLESISNISEIFNTNCDIEKINEIKSLIDDNNNKKYKRKDIKVKVYGDFLTDTVRDMGYRIVEDNYDYIVIGDYMKDKFEDEDNLVVVASHKNVSLNVIKRINKRYQLLESKLCTKQ